MSAIRPYQDLETRRQYKNMTSTQKKNISEMKEAVVVNNMIKEPLNLENMYDNLVIPEKAKCPGCYDTFEQTKDQNEKNTNKSFKTLLWTTLGTFGALAAAMGGVAFAAKAKTKLPSWKTLPEVPKNVAINNEPHFVTYLMLQDPNTKTILGALGVFVLSAIGLVGKNFVDGLRAVWVRKKEADVQRDLQEKLIAVETQSFSGKMEILRNMLSEKAHELENELQRNNLSLFESIAFKQFINFKRKSAPEEKKSQDNGSKKLLGAMFLSTLGVLALGLTAFKSVKKTGAYFETYKQDMLKIIKKLIENSDLKFEDLDYIKKLCTSLRLESGFVKETLSKIKKPVLGPDGKAVDMKAFAKKAVEELEQISQKGAEAIAGSPGSKPSYYSHTNDDRAHLYNLIVNHKNPLLWLLFGGMSAVTVAGYTGTQAVEAIKDVEVIKENANTELNLQKRLVAVELKNFETKKRSVIEPLIEEFKKQARDGKDKKDLKTRAESILYEIKNGPPFVYS